MKGLIMFLFIQRIFVLVLMLTIVCLKSQEALCSSLSTPTISSSSSTYTYPTNISLTISLKLDGFVPVTVQILQGSTVLYTTNSTHYDSSPYTYTWANPVPGNFSLTAKVFYSTGSKVSSAKTITINAPNPAISLISPSNNASFTAPASISLAANASTSYGSITKVEFYNGVVLLGSDSSSPYAYVWSNVAGGSYSLTAKVYSSSGNVVASAVSNITVYSVPQFISFDNQCVNNMKK